MEREEAIEKDLQVSNRRAKTDNVQIRKEMRDQMYKLNTIFAKIGSSKPEDMLTETRLCFSDFRAKDTLF